MEHKHRPDITEQELDIRKAQHHQNQTVGKMHIFFKALWSQPLLAVMACSYRPRTEEDQVWFHGSLPFSLTPHPGL